jgi:hypothetical protein
MVMHMSQGRENETDSIESEALETLRFDGQSKDNSAYFEQFLNFGFQLLIIFLISASVFPALRWAESQINYFHLSQLNK